MGPSQGGSSGSEGLALALDSSPVRVKQVLCRDRSRGKSVDPVKGKVIKVRMTHCSSVGRRPLGVKEPGSGPQEVGFGGENPAVGRGWRPRGGRHRNTSRPAWVG